MAEIRTRVLLTNAVDDYLVLSGQIERSAVRQCAIDAVVDMTRVFSAIPVTVMLKLGLPLRAKRIHDDAGDDVVNSTGPIIFSVAGRETMEEAFVEGQRVIIGRAAMAKLQLRVHESGELLTIGNHPVSLPLRS